MSLLYYLFNIRLAPGMPYGISLNTRVFSSRKIAYSAYDVPAYVLYANDIMITFGLHVMIHADIKDFAASVAAWNLFI
jgi:hypothetical protein